MEGGARRVRNSGKAKKKALQAKRAAKREDAQQQRDGDDATRRAGGGSPRDVERDDDDNGDDGAGFVAVGADGRTVCVALDSDDDGGDYRADTAGELLRGMPADALAARAAARALRPLDERLSRLTPHWDDAEDARWLELAAAVGAAARAHRVASPTRAFVLVQHALQSGPLCGARPAYFRRHKPPVSEAHARAALALLDGARHASPADGASRPRLRPPLIDARLSLSRTRARPPPDALAPAVRTVADADSELDGDADAAATPPPPPPPAGDATTAVATAATAEGPPPHEPPPPPASRGAALAACDGFSPNQLKQLTAWREAARKFLFPSLYQRRAPPAETSCSDARKGAEAAPGESADGSASGGTSSDDDTDSDESDGDSLLVLCNK